MKIDVNISARIKNQKGMAMLETLPILMVFLVLISYGIGFFGVVHTGIMNSIATRTYAFETFSNRSDVTMFRDRPDATGYTHYANRGNRFHTTDDEGKPAGVNNQYATVRKISMFSFGRKPDSTKAVESDHNIKIYDIGTRNRKGGVEASPAWIMVGYGICIDARCGD
jgi:hypothetical protein